MTGQRDTHLCKPTPDIVPTDADNITSLQTPPLANKVGRSIAQQSSVAKAEVLDERRVVRVRSGHLDIQRRRMARLASLFGFDVAANETLVALAHDPSLAAPTESSGISIAYRSEL